MKIEDFRIYAKSFNVIPVQASAGTVADSDPECINKAVVVLGAIVSANSLVKFEST